ncbi:MAG: GntR family transcriptional regulator [Fimbriimonas sp.]
MSKRIRPVAGPAAEALRALIRNNGYRTGDMLDSEHRLAELLEVSRGTVRLAIDVLVASGELTRRPHSRPVVGLTTDRPAKGDGLDVYVWVSHPISDSASLMFLKGVSLGLKGTPYRMIVREPTRFFGDHVPSDERQFLTDLLENESAAGAIIQREPGAQNGDVAAELLRQGMPLVFVDSPPPAGVGADFVGSANLHSARRCVEHLIELGHENIACLVESDVSDVTRERIRGYWRAMRQAGLESRGCCLVAGHLPEATSHILPIGRFAPRCATHGAYAKWSNALVSRVLEMPVTPTALFVGCDVLAHSVGALMEGAGYRVPEDISLIGFDWLARWEPAIIDDLTTASQDFEGFGRHAADLLLDRLTGDAAPAPRQVLFPAPLVIRSSTAPRMGAQSPTDPLGDAALSKP